MREDPVEYQTDNTAYGKMKYRILVTMLARLRHLLGLTLTVVELLAVMTACTWPIALTLQIVTGNEFRYGFTYFLTGLALLAIATAFRRDRRRLLFLIGPFALFLYTSFLAITAVGVLINGRVDSRLLLVGAVAGGVSLMTVRWMQRIHDDRRQTPSR